MRTGRQTLTNGLRELGCTVWPSSANFLLFKLPAGSIDARACFESLLARGVIIRRLTSYDLPEHLRVTVGNAEENRIFLSAMRSVLEENAA